MICTKGKKTFLATKRRGAHWASVVKPTIILDRNIS